MTDAARRGGARLAWLLLAPAVALHGCDRSTVHEDIGVLDAQTCAQLGQLFIPGNAERGLPPRCAVATGADQICHLTDQKFDVVTKTCVPAAEADFPQYFLPEASSLLGRGLGDEVVVCLGGAGYGALDAGERRALAAEIVRSFAAWMEPLRGLAPPSLGATVRIIEAPAACPETRQVDVQITTDPLTHCHARRGGCAYPASGHVFLVPRQGTDAATVLHELGHVLGIADYYYDPEFLADDQGDPITTCLKGFFGSVMCHPRDALGPADRFAVRQLYCALHADVAGCPKPASLAAAHFGDVAASCAVHEQKNADGKDYALEVAINYDRLAARRASMPPYVVHVQLAGEVAATVELPITALPLTAASATGDQLVWDFAADRISGQISGFAFEVEGIRAGGACAPAGPNLARMLAP